MKNSTRLIVVIAIDVGVKSQDQLIQASNFEYFIISN